MQVRACVHVMMGDFWNRSLYNLHVVHWGEGERRGQCPEVLLSLSLSYHCNIIIFLILCYNTMLMWRKGEGGAMSEGRATPPSALVIVPAVMDKHKMLLHNNSNSASTRPMWSRWLFGGYLGYLKILDMKIADVREYRDVYLSENDQWCYQTIWFIRI